MRFAVCCIFCLSIVYAAILRHDGWLELAPTAPRLPRWPEAAAATESRLAAGLGAFCRRDPSTCIAELGRLGRALPGADRDVSAMASPARPRRDRVLSTP